MTRAAERLIVCGYQGKAKPRPGCWYELIHNGLKGQPGFEEVGAGEARVWRYLRAPEPPRASATLRLPLGEPVVAVPAWLVAPAPVERGRPTALSPSTAYDEAAPPARARQAAAPRRRDAAEAQAQAQARGTLIHRLLQSLPDVAPAHREAVAHSFVARAGAAFGAEDRARCSPIRASRRCSPQAAAPRCRSSGASLARAKRRSWCRARSTAWW
jgi:ATP-dependent helicase/nuclease subunit A